MTKRAREKLARAEANLGRVSEHTPPSREEFGTLGIVKDGIFKDLEDAIQNLLDVCALLVKTHGLGVPGEDYGFTELLHAAGLLSKADKELLDDLRACATVCYSATDQSTTRSCTPGSGTAWET